MHLGIRLPREVGVEREVGEMTERQEIARLVREILGEEGCTGTCREEDIYLDEDGWSLKLCGFVGAWKLGRTVEEAGQALRELGGMRFGTM